MTLNAYSNELQKIKTKVNELEAENHTANNDIAEAEQEYEKAVSNMNDEKSDTLHKKMSELEQQINNRTKKINILLNKNNPILESAANKTITSFFAERDKQLNKAEQVKDELEQIKEQYFDLCNQLKGINAEYSQTRATASRARANANYKELPQQARILLNGHAELVNLSELEILLQDIQDKIYKAV